jgi:hypothetical protein
VLKRVCNAYDANNYIKKEKNNDSKCAFKRRKDALYNLKSVACRQELISSLLMTVLISSGVDGYKLCAHGLLAWPFPF